MAEDTNSKSSQPPQGKEPKKSQTPKSSVPRKRRRRRRPKKAPVATPPVLPVAPMPPVSTSAEPTTQEESSKPLSSPVSYLAIPEHYAQPKTSPPSFEEAESPAPSAPPQAPPSFSAPEPVPTLPPSESPSLPPQTPLPPAEPSPPPAEPPVTSVSPQPSSPSPTLLEPEPIPPDPFSEPIFEPRESKTPPAAEEPPAQPQPELEPDRDSASETSQAEPSPPEPPAAPIEAEVVSDAEETPQELPSFSPFDIPESSVESPTPIRAQSRATAKRSPSSEDQETETPSPHLEEKESSESKKSFVQTFKDLFSSLYETLKPAFGFILQHIKLRQIFLGLGLGCGVIVLGILLYLGYTMKVYQSAYQSIVSFFTPKPEPKVEVQVDPDFLRQSGIATVLLFADNRGSFRDRFPSYLWTNFFFGKLAEPKAEGEIGLSTAYYFGIGQDIIDKSNLFIRYVQDLQELRNLYAIDVYDILDKVTDREKKLTEYTDQLRAISKKSTENIAAIQTEIDNLKISFNSLNPDKAAFERDFFVSLERLAGEKADFLLKSFIDVSQKQVTLKAHLAGLQTLLAYYVEALELINIRIEAIDKNLGALIEGIRVIDIPGANIDFIIRKGS